MSVGYCDQKSKMITLGSKYFIQVIDKLLHLNELKKWRITIPDYQILFTEL
jgi:hypothetical protein